MYTSHFQFNAKPFQICTDPRFLWLGEQHKEALAILQYGVLEDKGVIALSGGVGTGKTTLINALMCRIKDDVLAAVVSDPDLEPMDFFYYISNLFGITNKVNSKADFLIHFRAFLKTAFQQKKKVLLIIDEAQRLKPSLLEEIRLLSNIEQLGGRLLNVFLVGQNELNAMLLKPENRSLKQRITTFFNIVPLSADEVRAYIGYRLGVVGCEQEIFTDGAISQIFSFSKGYPRLINVICDQSLISAFVKNSQEVTAGMVASSAKDLQCPHQAPVNPPITNDVVNTRAVKKFALSFFNANRHKEKKRNRSKNEKVKNGTSSFRLVYIGLVLAFFIFSGYLLYQYRMGSPQLGPGSSKDDGQNYQVTVKGEPSSREDVHPGLSPPRQAQTAQIPGQRDEAKAENKDAKPKRKIAQTLPSPKKPITQNAGTDTPPIIEKSSRRSSVSTGPSISRSEKAEGELNPQAVVPSKHGTDPSARPSGGGGAAVPPASDASPPPSNKDKDPGAIIDWLIQRKK